MLSCAGRSFITKSKYLLASINEVASETNSSAYGYENSYRHASTYIVFQVLLREDVHVLQKLKTRSDACNQLLVPDRAAWRSPTLPLQISRALANPAWKTLASKASHSQLAENAFLSRRSLFFSLLIQKTSLCFILSSTGVCMNHHSCRLCMSAFVPLRITDTALVLSPVPKYLSVGDIRGKADATRIGCDDSSMLLLAGCSAVHQFV